MIIHIHSDGSYLSTPKFRSRFPLSNRTVDSKNWQWNVAIRVIAKPLENVMGSAGKAEIGYTYANTQESVPTQTALIELNHPQLLTTIQVDNYTAVVFSNKNLTRISKTIGMNLYRIQGCI